LEEITIPLVVLFEELAGRLLLFEEIITRIVFFYGDNDEESSV
jgi:hypothetical protein